MDLLFYCYIYPAVDDASHKPIVSYYLFSFLLYTYTTGFHIGFRFLSRLKFSPPCLVAPRLKSRIPIEVQLIIQVLPSCILLGPLTWLYTFSTTSMYIVYMSCRRPILASSSLISIEAVLIASLCLASNVWNYVFTHVLLSSHFFLLKSEKDV